MTNSSSSNALFFLRAAAICGLLAVLLGAFGAHVIEKVFSMSHLRTFRTAVNYQFYHTFALLFVGLRLQQQSSKPLAWAGYAFLAGIILFSGSLYWMLSAEFHHLWSRPMGVITPIGGTFFILGWILLFWSTFTSKASKNLTES